MEKDPSDAPENRPRVMRDVAAALVAGLVVLVLSVVLNLPAHVRGLSRAHPLFHADLVLAVLAAVTVGLAVLSLLRSRETQRQTSARDEAEGALIESERRYRDLVDLSPDAILVHADGRFVFANRSAARLLGAEAPSDLIGKPVLEVVHPEYRRLVERRIRDEAAGRSAPLTEQRFVRLDGRTIDVEVAGIPIAYGEARGGQIVVRDITDRKRAETRLQEAESRFRTLVERVPAVTYVWDARNPTGEVEANYISPQVESLLGYTQQEWQRDPGLWERHVHPDDKEWVLEEWERASRTGRPFAADYRFTSRDGRAMWIRDEATLLSRDDRGEPALYQGVMIEVTEQHRAEEQAREAEARYRTLVEQLPVVVYVDAVDDNDTPLYFSPQYERLVGYTVAERLADPGMWMRLVHPDDVDRVRAEAERTSGTGDDFHTEYRLIAKDGRVVWVRDEATLIRDEDGTPRSWQGVLIDITERTQAEEQLRRHDAILQAVGFAAERFLRSSAWEDSIEEVLERLGRAAGASRAYLYEALAREDGGPLMSMRYEWVEEGTEALMESETSAAYPYRPSFERWERELSAGRTFSGVVSEFPEAERAILETADILSTAFVPIQPGGETWGFVGFDDCRDARTWSQAEMDALRTAAETLSAAIARQQSEDEVRETQAKYRTLIEQIPAITYMTEYGQSTEARYVSPQVEALLGYSAEEWVATPGMWQARIHPDDRERVLAEDARTERSGETFIEEYRMIARDDSVVWVRDEAVLLRDAEGNPRVWQGVRMDITARKQAEQQLLAAEEKYRTLVERIPAITYTAVMGEGAPWLYVSPQVHSILGYTQEEWIENPRIWLERVHPDDVERVMSEENRSRDTLRPLVSEYRMVTRDGRVVWLRDEAEVVTDADGTPLFLSGVMLDITDRKAAEEQLRETEAKYRAMVEHIPAVLYIDLPDERMTAVYVSPQIEAMLGVTAEEYIDDDVWEEYVHPEDRDRAVTESLAGIRRDAGPFTIEYRMVRRDGKEMWIRDEAVVLRDNDGKRKLVQGVMVDITERKLAEQALQASERRERDAAEQLRELDEMKNTFLAAVSHELRSPLTSILGLALTLERHNLEADDETDLLARLSANARKLDRLLKDLLDIDRLNRGILTPQFRPMDIGALVRRTVEAMETLGGRHVLVESDAIVIPVDPPKIERIVENLVANAAKHTSSDAGIWVRVQQERDGALIVVEDDGAGIPGGLRDEIFEPFRQGPTESRHAPGTGIGLSLVARFAELHGGRAWVEDREGGGASFRVFLPDHQANEMSEGNGAGLSEAAVVPHPADRLRGDGAHGPQSAEPTALPADRVDRRDSRAG